MTTLTSEELAEFTPLNRAAVDLILLRRDRDDSPISPCWLCMSSDAREAARTNLVNHMNAAMQPVVPFTLETLAACVDRLPNIKESVAFWQLTELKFKQQREEGNPRAFFMS